ncbi:MAG: hypothetical protein ABH852_01175 [Methanobacteriota archaeon]
MRVDDIYEEKILSKWNAGLLGTATALLFLAFAYQTLFGPIGTRPAPDWFFLIMSLFFLGLAINFSRLEIRITPESIVVGYGIIKRATPREDIEDCYLDKTSAVSYLGWGIRLTRLGGKWRLVYNIIGSPRLVLLLKKGRFKELAFSTKNPEKVMALIKQWIAPQDLSRQT